MCLPMLVLIVVKNQKKGTVHRTDNSGVHYTVSRTLVGPLSSYGSGLLLCSTNFMYSHIVLARPDVYSRVVVEFFFFFFFFRLRSRNLGTLGGRSYLQYYVSAFSHNKSHSAKTFSTKYFVLNIRIENFSNRSQGKAPRARRAGLPNRDRQT